LNNLDKLKEIELFEGKTLDEIFKVIYDQSVDQQLEAMKTFKKLNEFVKDQEDAFMSGDKAAPYLDSAHKATENIIKMVTASQKLIEKQDEQKETNVSQSDILSVLDSQGIAPKRFIATPEEDVNIEESPKIKNING